MAERQPRLAHELYRGSLRHQKEAANILGALAANQRPDSEMGQAYAAAAMTGTELRARAGDFMNAAVERLHGAGVEDVGQVPQLLQSALMDVIGETLGDRGIAIEGVGPDQETRYFPNPRSVMRQGAIRSVTPFTRRTGIQDSSSSLKVIVSRSWPKGTA